MAWAMPTRLCMPPESFFIFFFLFLLCFRIGRILFNIFFAFARLFENLMRARSGKAAGAADNDRYKNVFRGHNLRDGKIGYDSECHS